MVKLVSMVKLTKVFKKGNLVVYRTDLNNSFELMQLDSDRNKVVHSRGSSKHHSCMEMDQGDEDLAQKKNGVFSKIG